MADWVLVPCLVQLRDDFNKMNPKRDRASDGSIGDANHKSSSDHTPDEDSQILQDHDTDHKNEVHALDVDASGPWPRGLTMEKIVQRILARCRAGKEKRLKYIIFNRRIWSASTGWTQKSYSGANPHDKHAHFSASYLTVNESNQASWELEEADVAITDADVTKIARAVWSQDVIPVNAKKDTWQAAGSVGAIYDELKSTRGALLGAISALAAKDAVDEVALAGALAPAVAPALAELLRETLPPGTGPVTDQQLETALEKVFEKAFTS